MNRLSTKCGIFDVPQPYVSSRPVTGVALLLPQFLAAEQISVVVPNKAKWSIRHRMHLPSPNVDTKLHGVILVVAQAVNSRLSAAVAPSSIPRQAMWDLFWTKCHLAGSLGVSAFPVSSHVTNCSTLAFKSGHLRSYSSQYCACLSAHPNGLEVNLMAQLDNRRLRRHLPNDLPARFLV
jgi:hypothetical protein